MKNLQKGTMCLDYKMGRRGVDARKEKKELIKHSFKKCGSSNIFDGSEDPLINIKDIEGYKMPLPEMEFQMLEVTDSDDDDDDDDEFEESSSLRLWLWVVLYTLCIFYGTFMIFEKQRFHI